MKLRKYYRKFLKNLEYYTIWGVALLAMFAMFSASIFIIGWALQLFGFEL